MTSMTYLRMLSPAILSALSLCSVHGASLILARGAAYSAFDPVTGLETSLATGSLDTVVNFSFTVDDGVAYQGGRIGGQNAITSTNLSTGATQDFILSGGSVPRFGGFDSGRLILARGVDYSAFDPVTGLETSLATGSLDTVVNFSFTADSGVAYQGGRIGGQNAITSTNLSTGATQDFILSGGSVPQFGGFDSGRLILARGVDYSAFDPVTGLETSLATGSLDTVVNFSFTVDDGVAYQGGRIGGQNAITSTNLSTGATQDFILSGGSFPQFGGFDPVPEPNAAFLVTFGMLFSVIRRSRRFRE